MARIHDAEGDDLFGYDHVSHRVRSATGPETPLENAKRIKVLLVTALPKEHALKVGDRAVAIGYAEMENIQFGELEAYQPSLVVSVGSVTNTYPDNITKKETTTPGPCFEFDAKIPGKMSGAPILVGSGIVTKGVVSRSWQDERRASGGLIAPIMGLSLANGKSLLQIVQDGSEGMAQIMGRGL